MHLRKQSYLVLIVLLSLALILSACSGSNNNGASNTAPSGEAEQSNDTSTSAFPRTIDAANGQIEITKKPERVAVVHWGYIDSILLFDLKSAALALPFTEKSSALHTDSYKPYVDKLGEMVVVGENTTVNMEALLSYNPDLIIAGNSINAEVTDQLEKIAKTVVIDEAKTDIWSNWQAVVTKFGEILGQEDVAKQYIDNYNAKLQEVKAKLAKVEGTVAFVQVRNNAVWLGGTKYLTQYYSGLGLKAPNDPAMEEGVELSLEGLSKLNPDHLFLGYFNYVDKSQPAMTDDWEKNAVWKSLKAVQNNQTYAINGELAMGYGPIGNSYGVQAVLEALE
ncbi:ABC transporter substrate-binding protein [Paenibacillus sp. CF384]|uniref:ABC transporter substrate-binding protein n=1 Tax=Paenibacillus sp. CF384 TaxID=1884382 RepID=UPI000899C110|nr:ABC transporter substrate-binding protein [Paenibacillus sp. CF384]SDX57321.1 iron complex transport system substrate-binding protein [Paenibacillus sp. CF384]